MIFLFLLAAAVAQASQQDAASSRKVLGSSVVTSVSVIMDAKDTHYADALGKPVAKPQSASQVASPIDLLNPDRYEFYTFDDSGDLVKRLMTLEEIQSIIASSGDGEAETYKPEKKVNDVVNNVQNVLKEEMLSHRNTSGGQVLDTPDVSSSWSVILPAIFGNSGNPGLTADNIFGGASEKPVNSLTPDTITLEDKVQKPMPFTRKPTTETTKKPLKEETKKPTVFKPMVVINNNQEALKDAPVKVKVTTTKKPVQNVDEKYKRTTTRKPVQQSVEKKTTTTKQPVTKQPVTKQPITTKQPVVQSEDDDEYPNQNVLKRTTVKPITTTTRVRKTTLTLPASSSGEPTTTTKRVYFEEFEELAQAQPETTTKPQRTTTVPTTTTTTVQQLIDDDEIPSAPVRKTTLKPTTTTTAAPVYSSKPIAETLTTNAFLATHDDDEIPVRKTTESPLNHGTTVYVIDHKTNTRIPIATKEQLVGILSSLLPQESATELLRPSATNNLVQSVSKDESEYPKTTEMNKNDDEEIKNSALFEDDEIPSYAKPQPEVVKVTNRPNVNFYATAGITENNEKLSTYSEQSEPSSYVKIEIVQDNTPANKATTPQSETTLFNKITTIADELKKPTPEFDEYLSKPSTEDIDRISVPEILDQLLLTSTNIYEINTELENRAQTTEEQIRAETTTPQRNVYETTTLKKTAEDETTQAEYETTSLLKLAETTLRDEDEDELKYKQVPLLQKVDLVNKEQTTVYSPSTVKREETTVFTPSTTKERTTEKQETEATTLKRAEETEGTTLKRVEESEATTLKRVGEYEATTLNRGDEYEGTTLKRGEEYEGTTLKRGEEYEGTTLKRGEEYESTTLKRTEEPEATTLKRAEDPIATTLKEPEATTNTLEAQNDEPTTLKLTGLPETTIKSNIVNSIEQLIQQAVGNIAESIGENDDGEKVSAIMATLNDKPMSAMQLETATAASSLFDNTGNEELATAASELQTTTEEELDFLTEAMGSILSQVVNSEKQTNLDLATTTMNQQGDIVSTTLKQDEQTGFNVASTMIEQDGEGGLKHASTTMKQDGEIVATTNKQDEQTGANLASTTIKQDEDLPSETIKQDEAALDLVSTTIKQDEQGNSNMPSTTLKQDEQSGLDLASSRIKERITTLQGKDDALVQTTFNYREEQTTEASSFEESETRTTERPEVEFVTTQKYAELFDPSEIMESTKKDDDKPTTDTLRNDAITTRKDETTAKNETPTTLTEQNVEAQESQTTRVEAQTTANNGYATSQDAKKEEILNTEASSYVDEGASTLADAVTTTLASAEKPTTVSEDERKRKITTTQGDFDEEGVASTIRVFDDEEMLPTTSKFADDDDERMPTTSKLADDDERVSTYKIRYDEETATTEALKKVPTLIAIITRPVTQAAVLKPDVKKDDSPDADKWSLVSTISPEHRKPPPQAQPQEAQMQKPVKLEAGMNMGMEETTSHLDPDVKQFLGLMNELAFGFWNSVNNGMSAARSVFVSPFAATSLLAMVFLGARGATSGEMNEILRLDDMVTFNPHLILKNITESIEDLNSGVATSVILRELYSDKSKGKLLSFYKERAKQFYDGHVEEVGFKEVGDVVRRRTNLMVKRLTQGKVQEFIKDSSIKVKAPLAGVSVSIFQTDCSAASTEGRDGELYFVVLPSIRQRRLIPIPAAVWKSGFLAGYEPTLDATAVAIGNKSQTVSTIFVIPGQQGISAPGDGLARLERQLMTKPAAWTSLLKSLIPRPGLEVQIPRFSHRSVINASVALQRMGMKDLFDSQKADLRGLNGVANDLYLSDILQINSFATCGEGPIGDAHHSEIYPATADRTYRRSKKLHAYRDVELLEEPRDYQRAFHDPLHDPTLYALPLPLRPRQARLPEPAPRLRFDRPFLYFVRHNPTGLILHMGRFNPRLLP